MKQITDHLSNFHADTSGAQWTSLYANVLRHSERVTHVYVHMQVPCKRLQCQRMLGHRALYIIDKADNFSQDGHQVAIKQTNCG